MSGFRPHSLCAIDLRMSDGADERHYLPVVEKQAHKRNGGFLFLPAHLPEDVSRGSRHGLPGEEEIWSERFQEAARGQGESRICTYPDVGRVQQQISEGGVMFRGENMVLCVNYVQAQRAKLLHLH